MNANPTYTFGTASLEIFLLLAVAFILGAMLCRGLKAMGLCCRPHRPQTKPHERDVMISTSTPRAKPASPHPSLSNQDMSYEADLRSLLRGRRDDDPAQHLRAPLTSSSSAHTSFQSRINQTIPANRDITSSMAAALDLPDEKHVDDLKKLEGIGPKVETLLNQAGIRSYAKLATMDREDLKAILEAGGSQFKMHEPKSWPYQAELAAKQNWHRLKEYQDFLVSGRNDL